MMWWIIGGGAVVIVLAWGCCVAAKSGDKAMATRGAYERQANLDTDNAGSGGGGE